MTTSHLSVRTPDGSADALLAVPDEPGPGVLLLMDAFGLRPEIQGKAERLARAGYTVLAPDILYRDAPLALEGLSREAAMAALQPAMARLDGATCHRDLGAYLDALGQRSTGPVGVVGYCLGGRLAIRAAGAFPGIEAVATFHAGRTVTDAPDSPHLAIDGISAEVYSAHADQDDSMDADAIATYERALTDAGVTYASELYEGARHGFTMADMPVYDADADARHWRALLDLLGRTLGEDAAQD